MPSAFNPPGTLLAPGVFVAVGVLPTADGSIEVIGAPVLLVPSGATDDGGALGGNAVPELPTPTCIPEPLLTPPVPAMLLLVVLPVDADPLIPVPVLPGMPLPVTPMPVLALLLPELMLPEPTLPGPMLPEPIFPGPLLPEPEVLLLAALPPEAPPLPPPAPPPPWARASVETPKSKAAAIAVVFAVVVMGTLLGP